mgnify:CR=1 FL=1
MKHKITLTIDSDEETQKVLDRIVEPLSNLPGFTNGKASYTISEKVEAEWGHRAVKEPEHHNAG